MIKTANFQVIQSYFTIGSPTSSGYGLSRCSTNGGVYLKGLKAVKLTLPLNWLIPTNAGQTTSLQGRLPNARLKYTGLPTANPSQISYVYANRITLFWQTRCWSPIPPQTQDTVLRPFLLTIMPMLILYSKAAKLTHILLLIIRKLFLMYSAM